MNRTTNTEAVVWAAIAGATLAVSLWGFGGCRKPPGPPPPPPPPIGDASVGDGDATQDGSVSDCIALPDLSCAAIAGAVVGFEPGIDDLIDGIRMDIAPALQIVGGTLCGQGAGLVFYLADDRIAHQAFATSLGGWTAGELEFDAEGIVCSTRQVFVRDQRAVILRTWREQGAISLEMVPPLNTLATCIPAGSMCGYTGAPPCCAGLTCVVKGPTRFDRICQ